MKISSDSGLQMKVPYLSTITFTVVAVVGVYILLAMLLHPADRELDYHFYSERGLVTGLSAVLLASAGSFALATIILHLKTGVRGNVSWVLIGLGFYFLALDEVAQFHERLGEILDSRIDSGAFRHWNDIIVILYGVVAVPILVVVVPSMMRYRVTLYFLALGFVFYFVHTLTDSMVEPPTVWSIIFEESAKLFCGAMLALSMLFAFLGAMLRHE